MNVPPAKEIGPASTADRQLQLTWHAVRQQTGVGDRLEDLITLTQQAVDLLRWLVEERCDR